MTGTSDGIKPNSVTIDSTDAGNGNTATASPSLKVINPPTISKVFGVSSIPFGATTSLTFTVTNPNSDAASVLNGIAFTDTLPTGGGGGTIVVATPNGLTNTCSTTPTATAGSGIVSLTGASLAPGAFCTISLNVQGTAVGAANNSVTVSDTIAGTGNTSTALLTVVKADTTTAVTSSVNPSVFGQSVTFTATVSPVAPGAGTPTGTVTFLDGGSPIGTGTLSGGVATFTTSALAVGNHTITTSYGGDTNFNGSTGSLTGNPQVVNKADTSTTVTSSANPSVFGQSVTFTATVSPVAPGSGTPTGTVTFLDGGSPVGSGTLSGGVATFTTSALAIGNHTITTSYGGNGNFNGSTGSLTGNPQVVNKADTVTTVTSSANPSVFGQSVTFTATVSPVAPGSGTPVGTVTFLDGGSPVGSGTLIGGIATFTTSTLSIGNHTITTSYGGDGNFNGSTGSLTGNPQVVNKSDTSTTVTSSVNPSVFGQSVTFTATVSPVAPGTGTPTGTVTFLDGGSPIGTGTLSGGIATFTTSALAGGNHTITTSYGGDGNFNGSTGSLTGNPQVVNKADTTTAVTSSANPSVFGQSVTFTATVSPVAPGAGTPTGTVTFLDGGSPIGTGTLSGGIATFTTSALAVGNHTITTSYGGDGNFNGSTGSLTGNPQVVNKANSTTTVTSSVNPSVFGQSVTFTATVSPVAPGAGTPTGTVTFLDGGSPIGTGTLSGGIATFTTSALAIGNHTITTSYGGDGNFNGSTGSLTGNPQVVNKANTATTVTSSQNPSTIGQSVTFTATVAPVAPGSGTPTGTVTFLDGGSPIGTGTLSGGVATFTTSALTFGSHTITTSYGGDGNFNGSTGSLTGNPQVVNKTDTTTTVTSAQNPSVFGQSVTFTATVAPVVGSGTPTGTVTFLDGGSPIGTGTLSGGIATFTTSALAVGNHTITTSYGGDGNFNGSTGSLTGNPQVVNKANSTTTVTSSLNPSAFGQSVTFTATVSPVAPGAGTPTGTVTFLDGGSPIGTGTLSGGIATFATSALSAGNHTITTSYGGDGNFNGSTGSLTGNPQVVNKANSSTTVTSSLNPSVFGQSVTFTATVAPVAPGAGTPTGTVTFLDGGSPIGTGTLSGGIASFTTSALAVGNHTITTSYGGDGNFNGSTGSLTGNPQVVNKSDTTTAVTSSQNPSLLGQSVTFTATVSPVAPGAGTPTGTVTFLDGGSPIGTGTLSGGAATFTTSALALGNHTITTSYGGDGNFNGSTGSLTGNPQVVNKANTATAVTSSQNPSALGQSVTFTATVSAVAPGTGTPTGTVTFLDGGSPIGTGTLSGGVATFTTSALAAGNHTITTSYGGDANFNGSTGSLTGNPQVVVAPPAISKVFTPGGIQPNGVSALTVTITNPAANTAPLQGVAFTDNFPANVVVATPNGLNNTCGGTATATAGSGTVSLTGGTIPVNSSCTVTVNVTSSFTGSYLNSTGSVSSTNGGTGGSASATLFVANPPTISKVFVPDTIFLGTKTEVSFTITNPNSNSTPPNSDVTLTGISFTDTLPSGLTVAASPNVSNDCGGTLTAVPGSSSITLTGGTLAPQIGLRPQRGGRPIRSIPQPVANGSCFISVNVTPASTGTFNNTTGPISANESGSGATSNTATLTVNTPPTPPALAKAFGALSIPLNGTTSLNFTVTNANASTQLVNLSFSDPLPAGLVVASPNGVAGTCVTDGAAVTANPGTGSISVAALNLPGNSSCTLGVNVTGSSAGTKNNVTGNITGTFDDGSGTFVNITGNAASASTVVVAPPSISKAFAPALIGVNTTSTLSFTITNPAANTVALAGVAVTDTLPANLVVATPNGLTGSCGGTVTAVAGSGSIVLTNGSIGVSSSCTFSVNVTSAVAGTYNNVTGPVSSTNGGTGNTATASLIVKPASLSITKTHAGTLSRGQIGATYTITVSNDANAGPTVGTVTVADTLPPGMTATSMSGPGWTCVLSTTTCTRSDVLAPGASYPPITLVVNLAINISGQIVNTATVSGGGDPNSHTAMDASHVGPPLNIFLTTLPDNNITINAGGTAQYVFTVDSNVGGLGGINFSAQGLPLGSTVNFDKQGENLPEAQVTMTITTVGPAAAAMLPHGPGGSPLYAALMLPGFGMGLVLLGRGKKTAQGRKLRLLLLAGFLLMLLLVAGCGGHANNNGGGAAGVTPSGSYAISITATSSTQPDVQATTTVNLTVR
ncbi:MAG TPA: Ig-like domain repeat protein [Candidatus Angelobacter sp.]|nr:Ig-like domain repeat protein [Candidatus Angelobacter sp.]